MNEQEYIEIRLYLIGSAGVGKKSILSKIEALSSSKNILNEETPLPIQTNQRKSVQSRSSSISGPAPVQQKQEPPKPAVKTMTKHYKILQYTVGVKAYILPEANQVDPNYDPFKEEDEDDHIRIIQKYNISFKNTKRRLAYLIQSKITNEDIPSNFSVEHFMVFCFDLSNYKTFEHMMVYYQALSKQFNLSALPLKIVLGNKVEKKVPFKDTEQEVIDNFLKETSMKMYEISTKTFFPFSKFFELFFFNHFNSYRAEFNSSVFKEKFNSIIFSKPTFGKAPRKTGNENANNYPGPFNYETNVYDYGNKDVFDDLMINKKKKYNTKIFLNKIGPIFNKAVVSFLPEPPEETEEEKKKYRINFNKKTVQNNPCGYSLGIRPGLLNLKCVRQEKLQSIHKELRRSFDSNSSTLIAVKEKRVNDDYYFQLAEERKSNYIKKLIKDRSTKNAELQRLREVNIETLRKNQSAKDFTTQSLEMQQSNEEQMKKKLKAVHSPLKASIKKEPFITPGPDAYDVRREFITKNIGVSITGKRMICQSQVISPPFNNIPSDFDVIIREAKRIKINHFNERFPSPTPIQPIGKLDDINNRLLKWMKNKDKSKRSQLVKSFIEKRRIKKIDHDYLMNEIALNKEESQLNLQDRLKYKDQDELKPRPINYNLVYERSPSYSIKGRYYQRNRANDDEEDFNPFTSNTVEESVNYISNRLSQAIHPLPQITAVKPSVIGHSFTKEKRFCADVQEEGEGSPMIFEKGQFALPERSEFSSKAAFDINDPRFVKQHCDDYPGPGEYKIKGLSDNIKDKAALKLNCKG